LRDYCAQHPTTGWLFTGESSKPLSDRNLIQRHVYPVAQRLGIPHYLLALAQAHVLDARRKRGEYPDVNHEATAWAFKAKYHRPIHARTRRSNAGGGAKDRKTDSLAAQKASGE